ncbi:amidohydrolase family protein, partial [Escherichia coli]|nr:amidohydrolase family protein [Escherichia coli]
RDIIYGIKVHPYHSKMAFNSDKVQEYIRLAQKYDLPVVSHTSNDYESSPQLVYEMALKYPNVNFVMCHMGLATDNQEAIELIAKLPNLYGDTAWVRADMVYQSIKICGSDKILFGTD